MSLGNAPALMCLLYHGFLRLRRETDERWLREVARSTIFEEVRSLVQVLVDGEPQFVRRQIHQIFPSALGDFIVHLLLEKRQVPFGNQAETHRIRPAPPNDIAGSL